MQELVLDLHLHSRFSRAVSPRMNLANMYLWGRKKGINILTVSDFTHPIWYKEAVAALEEVSEGVYGLKKKEAIERENAQFFRQDFLGPYFILSCEVSSIYTENGAGHRIHNLIFAPNLETAGIINREFLRRGFNLSSDGRPVFGITSKQLAELLFEIDPKIAIIPCHAWTPWFSLYGSRSGYDHIADCFGQYAPRIFAIETGLSSDPAMNWRIKELASRSIVSFSDAHSLEKMGREATVLQLKVKSEKLKVKDLTYSNILNSFVRGRERVFEIAYTIEFYPEEGKYHYTGHRNCGVSYSPANTPSDALCPVCKRPLTVGVMHRVDELATFVESFIYEKDEYGVVWVKDKSGARPPFVSLVPLLEILAEVSGSSVSSQKVVALYDRLIEEFSSEHDVLFRTPSERIRMIAGLEAARAVEKVRSRDIEIVPGYDGEYGKVAIGKAEEEKRTDSSQMDLF